MAGNPYAISAITARETRPCPPEAPRPALRRPPGRGWRRRGGAPGRPEGSRPPRPRCAPRPRPCRRRRRRSRRPTPGRRGGRTAGRSGGSQRPGPERLPPAAQPEQGPVERVGAARIGPLVFDVRPLGLRAEGDPRSAGREAPGEARPRSSRSGGRRHGIGVRARSRPSTTTCEPGRSAELLAVVDERRAGHGHLDQRRPAPARRDPLRPLEGAGDVVGADESAAWAPGG